TPQKGAALQVHAGADDFPEGNKESEHANDRAGLFVSRAPIAHVALVRVMLGNSRIARIPIEILDDGIISRVVRLDPGAEQRDRLDFERRALLTRITDGRLIQVRCFQEITALEQDGKKIEARQRGNEILQSLDRATPEFQEEIDKLQARAKQDGLKVTGILAECEQQLNLLRDKQGVLRQHLKALDESIKAENDPLVLAKKRKVQDLIRAAELHKSQADYDQALAKYEAALAEVKDDPTARQAIDVPYQALKKGWQTNPGDPEHITARRFIVETWPKLATIQNVRDELGNARRAFTKCKAVGDRLAINKMHLNALEIATRCGGELKKFNNPPADEEEKASQEMAVKVFEELLKFLEEVREAARGNVKK
ncbi:MAG: hypothetical protein K8T89_18810, partial [Planctomycetes bacterium]|nr:hypothetical protein [Planctomycetota bacterium]